MTNDKRTNFSLACTLLSKMVKEKGSFGIGIGADLAKGMHVPPTTMNLLSGLEVSAGDRADTYGADSVPDKTATKCMDLFPVGTKEPERSPLTIFYGGSVFVFDDFPAEKAKDLMQMASNASPAATEVPVAESCPPTSGNLAPAKLNHSTDLLAQTRRASLHRFLNKRKERINAKAPYQVNGSAKKTDATAKPDETRWWLGLGQEISMTPTASSESRR